MILVVGGAGYIGSHMVKYLHDKGHAVVTLDNLSTGYRDAVRYGEFVEGDLADDALLEALFGTQVWASDYIKNPFIYVTDNM
jgi:UDP-glucose 4-epimerase